MAIDFPTSPTPGQQVTSGSRTWTWSGSYWANNTITGVQGTQGLQGTQGTQGIQGIQGLLGTQGAQGLQGIQGIQGVQGIQGNTGIQGTQGTQGIQGIMGAQGAQGTQGTQGAQGIQGTQGTQGLQGIQGISGSSILGTNNTWTGTNSFTTVGATGTITKTNTAATNTIFLSSTDTTTGGNGISIVNSGGAAFIGLENSAGSYQGGTAYDLLLAAASSRGVSLFVAGTGTIARATSTGFAVTGLITATGQYQFNGNRFLDSSSTELRVGDILNNYTTVGLYCQGGSKISLSGTGASVTGTLSATGIISSSSSNEFPLRFNGATTGATTVQFTNTGGNSYFGAEGNTTNNLIVGCTAYDTIIRGPSGLAFSANGGSNMQMRLSSTGLAVTGTLTASGLSTLSSGVAIRGNTAPASGSGLELVWDGTQSVVQSYNRTSSAYQPLWLEGGTLVRIGLGGSQIAGFTSSGLAVTGNITFSADLTERFIRTGSYGGAIRFRANAGSATDRSLQFGYIDGNNAWSSLMTVDTNTGNVGIGTTSPTGKLMIAASTSGLNNIGVVIDGYGAPVMQIGSRTGEAVIGSNNYSSSPITFKTGMTIGDFSTGTERMRIDSSGNVGIGTTSPGYKLEVNGSFAATTKSFIIEHPTKPGMKLRYGSLEGPENGVYVRGKSSSYTIELPDYWTKLVDPESITVQITPYGAPKNINIWVSSIADNTVRIASDLPISAYFYFIQAERIDVEKLEVEI